MKQIKIVILDSYPANPGDLSWSPLAELGELTVYEHCPHDDRAEILRRCAGAEVILTNKVPFDRELMAALPQLRFVALQSTGFNIIDLKAARELGITVSNVPGYSTVAVAQLVFALILELASGVAKQSAAVAAGEWSKAPDFTFYAHRMQELDHRILGIFGFGAIGQRVARIGAAFGMEVIYHSRTPRACDFARFVSLEELFRTADVLTLHAPQTPSTAKVVNREHLSLMKPGAFLINTARGGLVDSAALADALNAGTIAGAGIDTLETEPPPADHPLLHARNCLITPHVGWATQEARGRLIAILAENIRGYLAGHPVNVVNS